MAPVTKIKCGTIVSSWRIQLENWFMLQRAPAAGETLGLHDTSPVDSEAKHCLQLFLLDCPSNFESASYLHVHKAKSGNDVRGVSFLRLSLNIY